MQRARRCAFIRGLRRGIRAFQRRRADTKRRKQSENQCARTKTGSFATGQFSFRLVMCRHQAPLRTEVPSAHRSQASTKGPQVSVRARGKETRRCGSVSRDMYVMQMRSEPPDDAYLARFVFLTKKRGRVLNRAVAGGRRGW